MGELHLEIIVDRCSGSTRWRPTWARPKVAYKETIKKSVEQDTKYARQSGGKGQYGHVKIHVEPNESGKATSSSTKWWAALSPRSISPPSTPVSRALCSPAPWPATPWWT